MAYLDPEDWRGMIVKAENIQVGSSESSFEWTPDLKFNHEFEDAIRRVIRDEISEMRLG